MDAPKKILKTKLNKILEVEFENKFSPETISQQDLEKYIEEISSEILHAAEDFWNIEYTIDSASRVNFSTKKLVQHSSRLLRDCNKLKDLAKLQEFGFIGDELNDISKKIVAVRKKFVHCDRRRPKPEDLRKAQIEELAIRIIRVLKSRGIKIEGSQRIGKTSTAVSILIEVFNIVFQGYFSQAGSISNLITDLRKKEQTEFRSLLETPHLDISQEELADILQDIKDYTF